MEEGISEIASVDEMEVENEILVENDHLYDSEEWHSGSTSAATASPSASATPGTSFTATPSPTQEMSNKDPLDFFRCRPRSYTKQRPLARCYRAQLNYIALTGSPGRYRGKFKGDR